MYMPVWGALGILALCVGVLWLSGWKFFQLLVSDYIERKPVVSVIVLPLLLIIMICSVWLGYSAVVFNRSQG